MRSIAIQIFDQKNADIAHACGQRLRLPVLIEPEISEYRLLLCYDHGEWFLRDNGAAMAQGVKREPLGDLYLSFVTGAVKHRFMYGGGKGQDIAKAVGVTKRSALVPLHILDATAGLGRDAFVLASLGCRVELCEENPIVQFLLEHALSYGIQQLESQVDSDVQLVNVLQRMSCYFENSITHMQNSDKHWDVIYLDPMFPERNKSAKVKKEMQYLQLLLDHDVEPNEKNALDSLLLETALQANCSRVVVKRPSHAPCLAASKQPSHAIKGKSTRFDVYALKALS